MLQENKPQPKIIWKDTKCHRKKTSSIRQFHSSEAPFQGAADARPFLSDQLLSATKDVGCLKRDMTSWSLKYI